MKTILKALFGFIFVALLLIVLLLFGLNNGSVVDNIAKTVIVKTGMNIKYSTLNGGLFSGFEIKDFNYEDKVKADLKFKADFKSARSGIIHVEDLNISNLWIDEEFLNSLTSDSNQSNKKQKSKQSFIKKLIVDSTTLNLVDFHYKEYVIKALNLQIDNLTYDMKKDIKANIKADIKSNVADAIIKAKIKDEKYSFYIVADPKKEFITPYTKEQNITIANSPHISFDGDGDFHKVKANMFITKTKLIYKDIKISPKDLNLTANFDIDKNDLDAKFLSFVDSSAAKMDIDLRAKLNIKDINNSLNFDLKSNLVAKNKYLKKYTKEQNLTIQKMPKIDLKASGNFDKILARVVVDEGNILYNDIKIFSKGMDINSTYSLKKGDLSAKITSDIFSDIANFDLDGKVFLNSKDINNTLVYDSYINITAPIRDIKKFDIKITKPTKVALTLNGNAKNAKAILSTNGELYYEKIKIKPSIRDTKIDYNLVTNEIDAKLFADIYSSVGKVKTDAIVTLDLDDLNNTLKYDANLLIKGTKEFKGINLSSLGEIKADIKGSLKDLNAKVKSPKLKLIAKSSDFDKFDIDLDTKKIDIGKIYRYLPKELQKSFVNVKSHGYYKLSQNEAKFKTKLRGLKYADKVISTKEFDFYMKGNDIKLSNFSLLADEFDMGIDLTKEGDEIKAKIKNKAINANAYVKLDPLFVDAKAHIDSIDRLIKEIKKVYPLEVGVKVDGALDLVANMEGEDAKISLNSKKIEFEDGNIVNLNLLSLYNPKRILIKNFDFELKGFEPKEFNRKVKLKRDGLITLNQETNTIDFALENILEFKGTQKGDVATGKLTAKNLMLAYKDYGSTKLTTKLEMFQSAKQMAVTGFVEFSDTEITYESSFLDVSKDPDIIIITREDKGKKPPSDNFLLNTFLDLDIRSKNEMLYKVDAGEIEFSPDIKVRKDFGSLPKITGKINVLDGQYDVADKRFQIEEGAIAFRGQEGSNPLLDLHVNWEEIDDVVIQISIGGDKNRPKLVFSSKPMMSKKDIFSYLLFGMSASETEGAATSANKAAEKIFGRAVAKDLARELNLDRLDMNRNTLGGIDVKAGKKIKKKSIIYYQNKMNESSLIYERKLSKKWSVETEVGKQGQGVDIFYRKGYK